VLIILLVLALDQVELVGNHSNQTIRSPNEKEEMSDDNLPVEELYRMELSS
ncbi:uncharacterized, partial [Tachysurus ichikawai]